jgi:hypothetical protein
MDYFAPLGEVAAHDFPVVLGCELIATWTKERDDDPEGGEKPLGVPSRLETSHAPFSLS